MRLYKMSKIFIIFFTCCVLNSTVCFAAYETHHLSVQMGIAADVLDFFYKSSASDSQFEWLSRNFSYDLKHKLTKSQFGALRLIVRDEYGFLKDSKFYIFQRFDQVDRVGYIGTFTKDKVAKIIFTFDKENRLTDFAFTPVKQPEAKAAK